MGNLQIERIIDGTSTRVEAPYTVESRMNLDQDYIGTFLLDILHKRSVNSYTTGGTSLGRGDSFYCYMMSILGYVNPLVLGGVVLSNEVYGEGDVIQPHETDVYEWNVPYAREDDPRYVAGVDLLNTYAGESNYRGTINKGESYILELGNKVKAHLVLDFPTHCANKEFNTVTFLPRQIYDNPVDETYGYKYLSPSLNSYTNYKYHRLLTRRPLLADYVNKVDLGDAYTRCQVADRCVLMSSKKKMYYCCEEYGLGEAVFDKEEYNERLKAGTKDTSAFNFFYNNGKWYLIVSGYGIFNKFEEPFKIVELVDFQFGADLKYKIITGTEYSVQIPSDFLTSNARNYMQTYTVASAVPNGDTVAFLIVPRGTTGVDSQRYFGHMICNASDFSVASYSKNDYYYNSSTYLYDYGSFGIPNTMHHLDSKYLLFSSVYSTGYYLKLDTSNMSYENISKGEVDYPYYDEYANVGGYIAGNRFPLFDYKDQSTLYFTTRGRSDTSDQKYFIVEPEFRDWLLRFKLQSPMQKTPDETMKLTFDITFEI